MRLSKQSRGLMKRKLVELCILAAKKRESAQTGFIHLWYDNPFIEEQHTIPLLENICFVLSLLRTKTSENILKAKNLLEKLICLEVLGNFPIYIHEYPECKDRTWSLQILPALHWILTDFHAVLGTALTLELEALIQRIIAHGSDQQMQKKLSFSATCKLQAYRDPKREFPEPISAKDYGDYLIAVQLAASRGRDPLLDFDKILKKWEPTLLTFLGEQFQERTEPQLTLFDLGMGHCFNIYSKRALNDHPIHLQGALIQPFPEHRNCDTSPKKHIHLMEKHYTLLFGDSKALHSLMCDAENAEISLEEDATELRDLAKITAILSAGCDATSAAPVSLGIEKTILSSSVAASRTSRSAENAAFVFALSLTCSLPEILEETGKMEVSLFCNLSPEHQLFIDGKKATTFRLDQDVEMRSGEHRLYIRFSLVSGQGAFSGHISRGNRPSQISCKGPLRYEAFDWKIGLRTLSRIERCVIKIHIVKKDYPSQDPLHASHCQHTESLL